MSSVNRQTRESAFLFPECPWSVKDVFIVFAYAVALFFVFCFWLTMLYGLFHLTGGKFFHRFDTWVRSLSGVKDFYALFLFYGALFVAMKIKIFNKYKISELDFFIRKDRIKDDVIYGIKAYGKFLAVLAAIVISVFCAAALWDMLFGAKFLEKVDVYFIASGLEKLNMEGRVAGVVGIAAIFIFAPFFEELFFRGCLYRALRQRWSRRMAITASSFIFSLLHGYFFLFIYVFWIGLLLASMYEKRQSLVAPLAFHMVNNLVVLLLLLIRF